MATVTNTVKLPDGSTPDRVDVVIELVASTTGKAAGWITATDVTLEAVTRPTVTNGAWTASLTPNADITPSGSVYKVTEYVDKTRYTHYISVGSGGGTLFDLLTEAPDEIPAPALAAHVANTTNVHGIADTSVLATDTDVSTAVSTHAAAVDPHGDRAYADGLASNYEAAGAVSTHSSNTTNVHGIADTSTVMLAGATVAPSGDVTGATDRAAIAAAIIAAETAGGPLYMLPGTYYVDTQIAKSVPIDIFAAPGSVTIVKTTGAVVFRVTGTTGTPVSLTSDMTAGTATVACDTSGFAAGDLVVVGHTQAAWSGSATQYQGMQAKVKTITDGTAMVLEDPAYASFLTSASAFVMKVNSVAGVRVRGVKFSSTLASNTTAMIQLKYVNDVDIDIESEKSGHAAVRVQHGFNVRAKVKAYRGYDVDDPDGTGLANQFGYGVEIAGACSQVTLDVDARRVRHAVVVGGISGEYGEPNNVLVRGIGIGCTTATWDCHSAGVNVVFADCLSYGSAGPGFMLRGRGVVVSGGLSSGDNRGFDIYENGHGAQVVGLRVRDAVAHGGRVYQGVDNVLIEGCDFDGTGLSGIRFSGTDTFTGARIVRNTFRTVGELATAGDKSAIVITGTGAVLGGMFYDNVLEDAGTCEFFFDAEAAACTGTSCYGNHVGAVQTVGGTNAASIGERRPTPDKDRYWRPAAAIAETVSRVGKIESLTLLTSGTLSLFGGAVLPAGVEVSSISFSSAGTGANTPTNQWFCIVDLSTGTVLAKTADDTTTAWGVNTQKTLALASAYTPDIDTPVYLGVVVVAATAPTLFGAGVPSVAAGRTPMVAATADTGLTDPASLGATIGAKTTLAGVAWGYVL